VGLNLFLLAAMILSTYSLPAAYAQRVGAGMNYISVTCEADLDYDVFYLVDLPNRTLHAFIPARTLDGKLQYVGSRDLARDFEGQQ
jgi:hypothetical protein